MDEKVFMSIVTRTFGKRPNMFVQCCESINNQLDKDYEHVIIKDNFEMGVPLANALLAINKNRVGGDYVFILDDDNILITDDFISDIKSIVKENDNPEIIFVKKWIENIVYPRLESWNTGRIGFCEIDTSCVVVRNDLWKKYLHYFFNGETGGDFNFIHKIYRRALSKEIYWQDRVYSKALGIGNGRTEENIKKEGEHCEDYSCE